MSLKTFTNGIFKENPTFVMMLGLCPTLAVSTKAVYGLGMGVAATVVLLGSNIFISLLRNFIPSKVRIPAYIVVISTFVTIVDLLMAAYLPPLHSALGIFIPLIVVNCIILGRAEAFAQKNGVWASILDALGMGVGFTGALLLIGMIREFLGAGSLTFEMLGVGFTWSTSKIDPMIVMILPPGAFLTIGLLMAMFKQIEIVRKRKAARTGG
jgi:electron transport complex protein RnfE